MAQDRREVVEFETHHIYSASTAWEPGSKVLTMQGNAWNLLIGRYCPFSRCIAICRQAPLWFVRERCFINDAFWNLDWPNDQLLLRPKMASVYYMQCWISRQPAV